MPGDRGALCSPEVNHFTEMAAWGRVSSSNAALNIAKGELFFALDADTSFDNDTVSQIVQEFTDPNVPAVGGSLRVRNDNVSLVSRMQALEYMISLQGAKTGLVEWNVINSISGAFGALFPLRVGR